MAKYNKVVPYNIGEKIIYKNNDHIEKGVIEDIAINSNQSKFLVHVKFSGNRKVTANLDQIISQDESDVATIPFTSPAEYMEQVKCLNEEELQVLKYSDKMSELQKKWMMLQDQYGHLSTTEMERLLDLGVFLKKYKKLLYKNIISLSCILGHMRKRP